MPERRRRVRWARGGRCLVGDEGVGCVAGAWGRPGGGEGGGLKPLVLAAPSTRLQRCWQHPGPARAAPATSTTTHSRAPGQQEPPHLLCVLQIQQARLPSTGESSGALERTRAPRWDVERMLCAQVSSALVHTHPSGSSELWEQGSSCCLCSGLPCTRGLGAEIPHFPPWHPGALVGWG